MGDWSFRWLGRFGRRPTKESESSGLRIAKVKVMDGAINAKMFKNLDKPVTRLQRPVVPPGANGDELLKMVVDPEFVKSFNAEGGEAVAVMTRCGFIPLGIAADGADGNVDTLYVLINEQNAALKTTPYMPPDVFRNLTAVLARKVSRVLAVKLVRVRSSVVNLAIDYVYYSVAFSGDDDRPCCLYAAAPYLG